MTSGDKDRALREHLQELLRGKSAHVDFRKATADFPEPLRGVRPAGADHSAWELVEHMRIAQWDILEFSRNPNYVSPAWPEGYWPTHPEPPPAPGRKACAPFAPICRPWKNWLHPPPRTSTLVSPGATARPSCGKPCWRRTITPTTSGSSCSFANCSARGVNPARRGKRLQDLNSVDFLHPVRNFTPGEKKMLHERKPRIARLRSFGTPVPRSGRLGSMAKWPGGCTSGRHPTGTRAVPQPC